MGTCSLGTLIMRQRVKTGMAPDTRKKELQGAHSQQKNGKGWRVQQVKEKKKLAKTPQKTANGIPQLDKTEAVVSCPCMVALQLFPGGKKK